MNLAVYIDWELAKSKKAIKEAVAKDLKSVRCESTDLYHSFNGQIMELPDGLHHYVGPDPYKSRKFYGSIEKQGTKLVIK